MGIFKRILSTAVSAACALTLVFGSAAVPFAYPGIKAEAVASSSEYRDKIERIVELVNEERAKDGVAPVTLNETLTDAAMLRAEEITEQFSHTRPDNTSCFTVLKDYDIGYYACAENIAAGNSTADATMNQWVNSSGHYNNLMNATYTEIGVGVVYAPDSEYGYYWVQLFIKPTNPVQTTTAVTTNTTTWATTLNTVKTTTSTSESHTSYTETTTTTTTTTTKVTTTSAWITTPATTPTYKYGDLRYRIDDYDGYVEIVGCDLSAEGTVVIPDSITVGYGYEYPVKSIGQDAFELCKNITEVVIPDSVSTIGQGAFYNCSGLTSLNISDGVTEIDSYAFYKCSGLTDVNIPESVKYIRKAAFGECSNLKSITINNPECYISGEKSTISNIRYSDVETDAGYAFYGTIYGYTGSTAQTYAKKYGHNFVSLDEPEVTTTAVTTDITTTYTTVTTDVTETESQPPVTTTTTETSFIIITSATTAASISGFRITTTSVSESRSTGTVVTVTIPIISTVSSTVTSSDTTSASASTSVTTTEIITTYLTSDLTSATSQTTTSVTSSVSVSGTTVSQTTQTTPEGDIRLSRTSLDMSVGDRILLKIFGYEGTVKWVYSDPKIALVDENGYVEAVGEGSTTVYAVYGNGILSCSVTVEGTGTSETNIGDANGDGKLDVRDAAYIARMLAGGQSDEIPLTADFNGDGQVNVRDAAAIARFLANAHQ